jgi:predicted pyridoxine 5'-phosphate oxidase superfamily flavin-nucleotide-binding protein
LTLESLALLATVAGGRPKQACMLSFQRLDVYPRAIDSPRARR